MDDASKLAGFRAWFDAAWGDHDNANEASTDESRLPAPKTTMEILRTAEAHMAGPSEAKQTIDGIFDGIIAELSTGEFANFFSLKTAQHSRFEESTAREFMIRVLSRESRPDQFVIADVKREKRKPNVLERAMAYSWMNLDTGEWIEKFDLELNCKLERAQLRVDLVPKFRTLEMLTLVVTCAPSLERCYVFEMVTRHPRTDWDKFADDGSEAVRRWYKVDWESDINWLIGKVRDGLRDAVRQHVEAVAARLD